MTRAASPIINHPEKQPARQRLLFGSITAAIWALWIYLWLPLLSALLWLAGVRWAFAEVWVSPRGPAMSTVATVIVVCAIVVALWVFYARIRFGRRQPLHPPHGAADAGGSGFTAVRPLVQRQLCGARVMILHFDSHGRIVQVQPAGSDEGLPPDAVGELLPG